jgi:hypothetical protein
MGAAFVGQVAGTLPGFPADKLELLQHLLLSHHGEREKGSPVTPKILEALILHHLDDMDAKMAALSEALEEETRGRPMEWTSFNKAADSYLLSTPRWDDDRSGAAAGQKPPLGFLKDDGSATAPQAPPAIKPPGTPPFKSATLGIDPSLLPQAPTAVEPMRPPVRVIGDDAPIGPPSPSTPESVLQRLFDLDDDGPPASPEGEDVFDPREPRAPRGAPAAREGEAEPAQTERIKRFFSPAPAWPAQESSPAEGHDSPGPAEPELERGRRVVIPPPPKKQPKFPPAPAPIVYNPPEGLGSPTAPDPLAPPSPPGPVSPKAPDLPEVPPGPALPGAAPPPLPPTPPKPKRPTLF